MNLIGVNNKVVIIKDELETISSGGIILDDSSENKTITGVISSVGSNVENKDLKPGVTVLISKFGGTDLSVFDKNYTTLREEDILAIME